jgi:hypothetical protein
MRFSRHARQRMRQWSLSEADVVEFIMREAGWISLDSAGNIRINGAIREHGMRAVLVVDDPGYVITIHEWRGGAR